MPVHLRIVLLSQQNYFHSTPLNHSVPLHGGTDGMHPHPHWVYDFPCVLLGFHTTPKECGLKSDRNGIGTAIGHSSGVLSQPIQQMTPHSVPGSKQVRTTVFSMQTNTLQLTKISYAKWTIHHLPRIHTPGHVSMFILFYSK